MRDIHTFVILAYLENDNLEQCIKSVLNQTVKSNVIIATSTKNDFIIDLASEYGLGVMVNDSPSNKGSDYNYALNTFDTKLVTIAHQDDIYDRNYVKEILKSYEDNSNANIIFTNHYEVLEDKKIKDNLKKKITKLLLKPLKYKRLQNKKYFKNLTLKYKQCFCTSSVTYVKENIKKDFFSTDLTYNNDWLSFINLARDDSKFVYIDKKLVGKRIDKNMVVDKKNDVNEPVLINDKFSEEKDILVKNENNMETFEKAIDKRKNDFNSKSETNESLSKIEQVKEKKSKVNKKDKNKLNKDKNNINDNKLNKNNNGNTTLDKKGKERKNNANKKNKVYGNQNKDNSNEKKINNLKENNRSKKIGKRKNKKEKLSQNILNDEKINEDILVYKKMWPLWLVNYLYKIKEDETIIKDEV